MLWNRFLQTGSTNDRQRCGRPRITTPGQVRYIRVFHLRNRTVAASTTAAGIPGLRIISSQIVWNQLRQHGIRPRRPYFGAAISNDRKTNLVHVPGNLTAVTQRRNSPTSPHARNGPTESYSNRTTIGHTQRV
jgi:hypothetical protein